jgi:predicted RND superfamily exporter protein
VIINGVLNRSGLMSVLGISLTLVLFAVSLTLRPDQRQSNDLPLNSEATIAFQHMDKAFGGLEFSRVDVSWTKNIAKDSPEILNVVTLVDDLLNSEELIGHPLSIRNLIDAQPGSGPAAERMTLMELLPPPLKRAFFVPERRQAKVTFRVQDLGIAAYGPVFERLENGLQEIQQQYPEFELKLDGGAVWRWKNLYQIVVDLAKSLGSASVIIFVVLSLVYRSLRIGLISIIPNAFPLVFTGAYLALAGYNLEIVMVCNFTICLGIAVDDTIHFLTRYLEERRTTSDEQVAIRNAFTGVGTALIMTTTVLVCGFSTVTFSESRDHRIFATMGALTIAAALVGDLLFLPALLKQFAPGKK